MKILFVGDVVGRPGRKLLTDHLPAVQRELEIDFTIVNVENAAGGFGVTPALAQEILSGGVDVMTTGNHVWDKREIFDYLNREPRLLRPGNYPKGVPGSFVHIGESRTGARVAVMNLQGRVFMPLTDCPFRLAEKEIPRISRETRVIVIDFHAEATSEKLALGWFLDGQVSAVIGTHTHIPTADCRILPKGTAYVTDVGMTGPYDSVIGMEVNTSLSRFLTGLTARMEVASENPRFSAILLDVDESTGMAKSIRRIER
ncbi:MAG: TIGR00282 family metallophosphoesterase [Acidobacteria bacterium]|nr:MAG: TIGR00282 family metallophosphoesterase [Acidobacteriota bacterium]